MDAESIEAVDYFQAYMEVNSELQELKRTIRGSEFANQLLSFDNQITFILDTQPLPKQRPRFGNGKAYTPDKTKAYEDMIGVLCRNQMIHNGIEPYTTDVHVEISFYRTGNRRADLDNLCKAVLDGINGIAFTDDKQVVKLTCQVFYNAKKPCAIVTVGQME